MNAAQTALIYVGSPAAIALVLVAAVYGRTATQQNRYRPGRPWTYDPVWYVGSPKQLPARPALPLGATPDRMLTAATMAAIEQSEPMGGASGEW
jgi:hypothetical protein